jgi:hypothetical protein
MSNQWPEEKKIRKANWIIVNDEKEFLIPQVVSIDNQIKEEKYGT